MSLTLIVPSESSGRFSAPVETVLSQPTSAALPRMGSSLLAPLIDPRIVELRPPIKAFRGHCVVDPVEERIRKYQEDNALSFIAQAEELAYHNPDSKIALARLAQTLAGEGRQESAIDAALRVLEPADANASSVPDMAAKFVAARVLVSAGQADAAEKYLAILAEVPGPWTLLYAAIAHSRGENLQALARLGGSSDSEAAAFRGYLLLELGRAQEAAHELRSAGGESSRSPSLLANLAYAYGALGSTRKAIRAARQAVAVAPRSRTMSLNLVGYFLAVGDTTAALSEVHRLSVEWPSDYKVASAMAHVFAILGDLKGAHKVLRQAVAAHVFETSSVGLSELKAQLAHLEWQMNLRSKDDLLSTLRAELAAIDGQSLPIVLMLIDLQHRTSVVREVQGYYDRLLQRQPADTLLPLRIRLAVLTENYDSALEDALLFKRVAPLNPDSSALLMSIQGHVFSDFVSAARTGRDALRRLPGNWMIRNSTAFFLALDGQAAAAREALCFSQAPELPILYATRGLVAFAEGSFNEGMEWYDRAVDLAWAQGGDRPEVEEFEQLARLYEWICLSRLRPSGTGDLAKRCRVRVPAEWDKDSNYRPVRRLTDALHVRWPDEGDSQRDQKDT